MNRAFSPPRKTSAPCFDAGSQYCPCDLAFLGECVQCSLIRGEDTCRCGWSGVCAYQEFVRRKRAMPPRTESTAPVLARSELGDAFILDLGAEESLARWCVFPGSFLMLRPKGAVSRYNIPVSVMRVRGKTVQAAIETVGPKTVALSRKAVPGSEVTVQGPYWSGLQGARHLRTFAGGKVLVIAKGIGQAPAVNTVHYLAGHGARVKALLGPGNLGAVFGASAMREEGALVEELPRSKDHNLARFYQELCEGAYDLLVSEGGDRQHRSLLDLAASLENPPAFAWSSNLTMTCAEGICGSCLVSGQRGCKAQIEASAALG